MRRCLLVAAAVVMLVAAAPASARRSVPRGFMGMVAGSDLVHHPTRIPSQFRGMAAAGVESVKAEFSWAQIEPSSGQYDWSEPDTLVAAAARHHMSVLPTVLQAPAWAAAHDGTPFIRRPQDPEDYARFMTTLIERYGPRGSFWAAHPRLPRQAIRAWEVWNEPELGYYWKRPWRRPYVRLLRVSHSAIKLADPGAKVVLAGLTYYSWRYMRQFYRAGARGLFDVVSLHPYTHNPANVIRTMRYVRRVMRHYRDPRTPIWVTELSWTSGKGKTTGGHTQPDFLNSTPRGQASLLRRGYLKLAQTHKRYGVSRVFWYTWLTRDHSRTDPFDWSGLRSIHRGHYHSKPALRAYRAVARRLTGRR